MTDKQVHRLFIISAITTLASFATLVPGLLHVSILSVPGVALACITAAFIVGYIAFGLRELAYKVAGWAGYAAAIPVVYFMNVFDALRYALTDGR